jgi:hypothetical protein
MIATSVLVIEHPEKIWCTGRRATAGCWGAADRREARLVRSRGDTSPRPGLGNPACWCIRSRPPTCRRAVVRGSSSWSHTIGLRPPRPYSPRSCRSSSVYGEKARNSLAGIFNLGPTVAGIGSVIGVHAEAILPQFLTDRLTARRLRRFRRSPLVFRCRGPRGTHELRWSPHDRDRQRQGPVADVCTVPPPRNARPRTLRPGPWRVEWGSTCRAASAPSRARSRRRPRG